uniref:Uncharacterized protein n=1 Tax=Ascaris lumbricoides TaxID=6252 RepID=A0A0M3IUH7_ASCLU
MRIYYLQVCNSNIARNVLEPIPAETHGISSYRKPLSWQIASASGNSGSRSPEDQPLMVASRLDREISVRSTQQNSASSSAAYGRDRDSTSSDSQYTVKTRPPFSSFH